MATNRPNWFTSILGMLITALTVACFPARSQEATAGSPDSRVSSASSITRFEGAVRIKAPEGKETTLHVVMREWFLGKSERTSISTDSTTLLIHLVSGRITINVAGRRQEAKSDGYWIVPPGADVSVSAGSLGAHFEATAILGSTPPTFSRAPHRCKVAPMS